MVFWNIRRINGIQNAQIRESGLVKKCLDERTGESIILWFGHTERRQNMVSIALYKGSIVGRPRERWSDLMND